MVSEIAPLFLLVCTESIGEDRVKEGVYVESKTWVYPRFKNFNFSDATKHPTTPFCPHMKR